MVLHLPQDVYKPEAARLRRHLSAMVNFAKFREEKLTAYGDMQVGSRCMYTERESSANALGGG
jgi:hypothetical protein